jgi:penicillin-binding protein 1C
VLYFSVDLPVNNLSQKESSVVYDRNGEMLRVFTKDGFFYLPYNEKDNIPEKLKKAVLFYEDRKFEDHFGVDFSAIIRAAYQNIKKGKIYSGASTVTMQLCRLMTQKKRSFKNKITESIQALKIERKWNKDVILRKYLTYCPYGQNIYGYKTASLKYFRKPPEDLNWSEAALLAILPNAPGLLHPEKNRERLTNKRNDLLKRMMDAQVITIAEYNEAVSIEPPKISVPFQTNAYHLTRELEIRSESRIIKTTLDKKIQVAAEQMLKNFSNETTSGLTNFAAIVTTVKDPEILAWVGSHNFFDDYNNGQVDALTSRRPVDGLLQPFLYALAIDKLNLDLSNEIPDTKHAYGNYTPTNVDGKYLGKTSSYKALREFRNVPAVHLLHNFGIEEFYTFLKEAGAKSIPQPPEFYGYSLISGGFDLQPVEIATLYNGLLRNGKFAKLKTVKGETAKENELISAKAALDVVSALPKYEIKGQLIPYVATCNRNGRECWTAVLAKDHIVLVWGGSMTGISKPDTSSTLNELRALAFSIFNAI